MVTLAPLVAITIAIGVYPKPIFDVTSVSVANLVEQHQTALMLAAPHSGAGASAENRESGHTQLHKGAVRLAALHLLAVSPAFAGAAQQPLHSVSPYRVTAR
jgi:hypothetical protein